MVAWIVYSTMYISNTLSLPERVSARGVTQSLNVGNDCGTNRPPFLEFHRSQNWPMYYINNHSNCWLIFPQDIGKVVKIIPNIVGEYGWYPVIHYF